MRNGKVRDAQIARIVAESLDLILASAKDPRLSSLEISRVIPKKGGRHFFVFLRPTEYSLLEIDSENLKAVFKSSYHFIKSELGDSLNLKRIPELTFELDPLILLARRQT